MKLRLAPRALAEAKRTKTWWRIHRGAPEIFEAELEAMLRRLRDTPALGRVYEARGLAVPVRRVLLPKTQQHVYYTVTATELVVLSVWGARRRRGPRL